MSYQFYYKVDESWVEFFPLYESLTYEIERIGVRKKVSLTGEIKVSDKYRGDAYATFYNLSLLNTNKIEFKLHQNSNIVYTGLLSIRNGKFNMSEQSAELSFTGNTVYDIIESEWEIERNILESTQAFTLSCNVYRSYTIYEIYLIPQGDDPISRTGMAEFSPEELEWSGGITYYFGDICSLNGKLYRWANQETTGDGPPGDYTYGLYWQTEANIPVLPYQIFACQRSSITQAGWSDYGNYCYYRALRSILLTISFDRCRKVKDVLNKYISYYSYGLIKLSETVPNHWCEKFRTDADNFTLYIADKSDIKYRSSSDAATINNMTFKDFLNIMKVVFNLDWWVNDAGYFQFIHPSERASLTIGLDLTRNNYINRTKNLSSFTDKYPNIARENFMMEQTNHYDFDNIPVIYYELGEIIDYDISKVCTNIAAMTATGSMLSDDGIVLIAADNQNNIINKVPIYTQYNQEDWNLLLNGKLSIVYLLRAYHLHDRFYKNVDVAGMQSLTAIPNKIAKEIKFICDDLNAIDVTKGVKTDMSVEIAETGLFYIKKITQKLDGSFATIELEF